MALPLALPLIPAAAKTLIGAAQAGAGLFTKRPDRPTYKIPDSIREATQSAKIQAGMTERPGASQYQAIIDQNLANTADTVKNIGGSASNVVQGLMNAQGQANRASLDNAAANEAFRYQSMRDKITALTNQARYEDKAWNWNEAGKYTEKRDRRDALISGGLRNIVGGIDDYAAMKTVGGMSRE